MRHSLAILTLLLVSFQVSWAQRPDRAARQQAAHQFKQQHGPQWQINWHEKIGTPSTLLSGTARGYTGPPAEAARAFLSDHNTLFGIKDAKTELELARQRASKGKAQVLYRQVYRGLPVLYSGYLVALNRAGEVFYVSGDYYPEIDVDVTPSLQPEDVMALVQPDFSERAEATEPPLLAVYVDRESKDLTHHLAYQVQVEQDAPPEAYEYVIDAHSGDILRKVSLIDHVNGDGKVYHTNPNHGSLVTRTLYRLDNNSPRRLVGDNVRVYNDSGAEAVPTDGYDTFNYGASSEHLDEVMAYYHGDMFEVWLIGIGMETGRVDRVDVHTQNATYYAATNSAAGVIYFGDADSNLGRRNPTREASVIAHEYMHVTSETYNSLTQNNQADAMDEAYSDYFALGYKNQFVSSSAIGEYIDEPGGYNWSRDLDNSYTFDQFATIDVDGYPGTGEHDRSVIFSGALWDFRQAVGSVADELVLESLGYLDSYPEFTDGRSALITVAGSQYECAVRSAFAEHGIGTACPPPLAVSISGPGGLGWKAQGTWTAQASGGSGSTAYHWYQRPGGNGSWQNTGETTQSIMRTMVYSNGLELKVEVTRGTDTANDTHFVYCTGSSSCGVIPFGGMVAAGAAEPADYALAPAYPNPFNPRATIRFALREESDVELVVYDVLGREVARLVDGPVQAGRHEATFEAGNLPSGVYLYELRAGDFRETGRMMLAK